MKTTTKCILTLILLFTFQIGFSQKRVAIYLQNASPTANVQYTKMTHLVHSFFNPMDNTGNITDATGTPTNSPNIWFVTANFTTMIAAARAANPNIKILISTGGAPTPSDPNITTRLNTILATPAAANELSNDLVAFIQRYDLDGWDFDLEHPVSTTEKNNHEAFLSTMRTKLNAAEASMCKDLEITIALNGETDHFVVSPTGSDYVNPTVDPYVDFYHLMTYDASYVAHNGVNSSWPLNHSPLIHAQEAVRDFASPPFNWPKSKMVIGIPFYGRNGVGASNYASINAGLSSTIYNADLSGGYNYNGCVTITAKVNYALTNGLAGVVVWEGSQDLNNSTGFSLASCLYTAMGAAPAWEKNCCEKPNLGTDLLTCNTAFPITLNSNTTTPGATFVWTRILPSVLTINASGSNTQSITAGNGAGTYVVARTAGTCTRRDTIVIGTGTLPTPSLGPDKSLCTFPYTLSPSNVNSFPPGTTFQWQKASVDIVGETNSTLYASSPGTYTLVATLAGCGSTSDAIVISASSAAPVDACRTTAGTLTLSVSGGTGPFTWYSGDVPNNTILGTGTSYTTPSLPLPSTTYYYVEDAGAMTTVTIGETAAPTGFANNVTVPPAFNNATISMEFDVKNPVKLQSVVVNPWGGATYPFSFAIEILNANNNIVYTSPTTTYAVWPGLGQVITLNVPLAVGKYRMRAVRSGGTNTPGFFHHNTSAFPYGSAQDLTITRQLGVGQYGPFYSWVLGDYNACPRIQVMAKVNASCSGTFLPVELLSFEAKRKNNSVELTWSTATERNNAYFVIERSLDGQNFTSIATINGSGNSQAIIGYNHTDYNAPASALYYRLSQVDINGTMSNSPIKKVGSLEGFEITLSPNPFSTTTSLSILGPENNYQIKLMDINGRILQSFSAKGASQEFSVGQQLPSGFYIIEVTTADSKKLIKCIKE